MADKKISDFTEAATLAVGDLFEIETSGGNSRKITGTNLAEAIASLTGVPRLITETVTAASASNVTFSSIPATYRDLMIRVRGRGDTAATFVKVVMQMNGDTAANYTWIQSTNGSFAFTQATSSIDTGYITAATSPASVPGDILANIFDYRGTTFKKELRAESGLMTADSANNKYYNVSTGWWLDTSAINSIKVFLSAGNFVDNSVVSLYGIF